MTSDPPIATNRQARRDYQIFEAWEAGIVLTGTEVKSLRQARCNLKDGFARFENGEILLYNVHIAPYAQGNIYNHDPLRPRKLLLHKHQIMKLYGRLSVKGLTLVPLKLYFKHGLAKCELGLAKSKKAYDRRDTIKRNEAKRDIDRAMKNSKK